MSDHKTLSLPTAIGRFGVAYVRKVCTQAHVGFKENDPDEDVLAVDADIVFDAASTRVQIKTSTHYSLIKLTGTLELALEPAWVKKWRVNIHPTYLILVLLAEGVESWISYEDDHTHVGAYALWARIDNIAADASHLVLDRSDRFTPETVGAWYEDLYEGYGEGASA